MTTDDKRRGRSRIVSLSDSGTPAWARPAPFVPQELQHALSRVHFESKLWSWSGFERQAIACLLQEEDLLAPVYTHLQQFAPTEQEWRSIVLDVFASSYHFVKADEREEEVAQADELATYYQRVSRAAHELFRLLSQESYCLPANSELSEFLDGSDIEEQLLRIVSASTSAEWPSMYHQWLKSPDSSALEFLEIERKRFEETPWYDPGYDSTAEQPKGGFPSLPLEVPKETAKQPWTRFLQKALEELDQVSANFGRDFDIYRRGNAELPRANCCFFLQPSHWLNIWAALFEVFRTDSPEQDDQKRNIRKIVRAHREQSPRYNPPRN